MQLKLISLLLFLGFAAASQGAINPDEFIRHAPEKVIIQVEASSIESKDSKVSRIVLMARVLKVEQSLSANGLKIGDNILITYHQDHASYERERKNQKARARTGWVGPQVLYYPPALSAGDVALAHLEPSKETNFSGATFQPVGHQYAFEIQH